MFHFATTLIILSDEDCELLGIKQLDHKPHHSPPARMKLRMCGALPNSPIHLHVVFLRHSDDDVSYLMKCCGSKIFQICL